METNFNEYWEDKAECLLSNRLSENIVRDPGSEVHSQEM